MNPVGAESHRGSVSFATNEKSVRFGLGGRLAPRWAHLAQVRFRRSTSLDGIRPVANHERRERNRQLAPTPATMRPETMRLAPVKLVERGESVVTGDVT
jgi:hypothetical protein